MGLKEWIQEFGTMHEQARAGTLSAADHEEYVQAREELASALLSAQKLELKGGMLARQSLRVQRTLQVDLSLQGSKARAMTLDISVGGFAAMLGTNPPVGEPAQVTLKLPDGAPLVARAVVAGLQRHGGVFRVAFAFGDMPAEARDRLGFVVFDAVLQSFKGS